MRNLLGILFLLFVIAAFNSCSDGENEKKEEIPTEVINNDESANGNDSDEKGPVMSFKFKDHHFGDVYQGESVAYTFRFTNTGDADLLITDAKASCGCTIPKFSKAPVAPGEEGEIEVIFDSSGRSGKINKTVTILANTKPNTHKLTITGEIIDHQ